MSTTDRMRMLDRIDRALTMLDCAEAIRDGGGAVEIAGVRITQGARRAVLAEITRDETVDGVRADGFPANDTTVVRDDGPGKGSTAAITGARSDAQPAEAPGEGRGEIGPQKGVQSLGDGPRPPESQLGRWIRALNVAPAARDERALLAAFADDIDADYTRVATEHDALTTERDRLAAEVAEHGKGSDLLQAGHEAGMAFAERKLAKVRAERDELRAERDEARTEAESLRRAAQVTTMSWRKYVDRAEKAERERDEARVEAGQAWAERDGWREAARGSNDDAELFQERADQAEAAVARVRALLDRPLIPSALLRDALDGAGMGERG